MTISMSHVVLLILGVAVSFQPSEASEDGLGDSWIPAQAWQDVSSELEQARSDELKPLNARLMEIMEALRPNFLATPRNEYGNLEYAGVRYVLHRFFIQRHGWYIKSLGPTGEAWNESSPGEVLANVEIQRVFETRLWWRGLTLRELSALASMLEDMVHGQIVDELRASYRAYGFPLTGNLNVTSADKAIQTYLAYQILAQNVSAASKSELHWTMTMMNEVYPSWPQLQKLARTVREEAAPRMTSVNFSAMSNAIVRVVDRYDSFFQGDHCKRVRSHLLALEDPGTGRVPLTAFYGDMANGMWQFSETPEYLQELGALDNESDPGRPSVVVPNYVSGLSNCLSGSRYHLQCCRSGCEVLFESLEREIVAPEARPALIAKIVGRLLIQRGQNLSDSVARRLDDIALAHDGLVPLHGRLFSQWMHHASPTECPYPHISGATNPLTFEKWESEKKTLAFMEPADANKYTRANKNRTASAFRGHKKLPWNHVEELFAQVPSHHEDLANDSEVWAIMHAVSFVSALAAMTVGILNAAKKLSHIKATFLSKKPSKYQCFEA